MAGGRADSHKTRAEKRRLEGRGFRAGTAEGNFSSPVLGAAITPEVSVYLLRTYQTARLLHITTGHCSTKELDRVFRAYKM
jgi:hypothetical protein